MHRPLVQFCDDPKKYPQNLLTPKILILLKTLKNIEIKILNPPKMTRAYVCMKISEYPPPWAPPYPTLSKMQFPEVKPMRQLKDCSIVITGAKMDLIRFFVIDGDRGRLNNTEALPGGRGYLFPCSPEIDWLVPLFPKNREFVFLCSLFPNIVFVPIFFSKFDICSPVPLK